MKLVVANFGYTAGGWRVDRHPRLLADLTGDGRADIVGFGDGGVWTCRNNGDGSFAEPTLAVTDFGYTAGGWRVDRHPRLLADLTGDGRADIVGFGYGGVWVSVHKGDGAVTDPQLVVTNFGYTAGGWRVDRHPRLLADLTGDGRADIVGFGYGGVWTCRNNGDGSFAEPTLAVTDFGYTAGGWRVDRHPRLLADLTGDGRADIVGFGYGGVWVSLNNGDGSFAEPTLAVTDFGYTAGGWRVDKHPRFLADLTGDGRADIVGFGDGGVWIALNNGDGTFAAPTLAVADFGYTAGGWRVDRHPRFLADLTGDGRADIVGFGYGGVWVSLNNGDGSFAGPELVLENFGYTAGGWRVDKHPRFLADLTGDGCADLVGFGDGGVWVSLNRGDGSFEEETVFVRRDVWSLRADDPWDPVTEAYARAVAVMQSRPITDPTSWSYQAAIHATFAATPPGAEWNDCQHQSWYFLPWHRMYLYYFERIVRAAVLSIGGPHDFAIPYWNYDQPFPNNTLPQPFREPTLPDGSPNPLLVPPPGRDSVIAGGAQLPPSATSSSAAMAITEFTGPPGPGFGGGVRPPSQFGGSVGALEQTPHNVIHVLIGGSPSGQCAGGLMVDPRCAALDPIFWLHHANIDRLWSRWLALGGGRANPDEAAWLEQSFVFHDETGAAVALTGAEVVDSATQLHYVYDDQNQAVSMNGASRRDRPAPPELVAATEQPVDLVGDARSVQLTAPPSGLARLAAADVAMYLNVEDIEAERNPGIVYGVYLNMAPEDADRARHHVGNVALFGIEQMNDPDAAHPGVPGFRHTFDVTRVVGALSDAGRWDPNDITVTFEPLTPIPSPGQEERMAEHAEKPPAAPVRVGRVSLFVG